MKDGRVRDWQTTIYSNFNICLWTPKCAFKIRLRNLGKHLIIINHKEYTFCFCIPVTLEGYITVTFWILSHVNVLPIYKLNTSKVIEFTG